MSERADTLKISETFTSIQGEGKLTGTPSFFVRVSGCNLRCGWCDTPYASWFPEGEVRSIDDIAQEAKDSGVRYVVLTGGEPMLFDAMESLSQRLGDAGFHITVETAGTIPREPEAFRCDLLSLSPKLANSTPGEGDPRDPDGLWRKRHEKRRLDFDVLQRLIDTYAERQFKFVVRSDRDLSEIDEVMGRLSGWSADEVMLMPEGVTVPEPGAQDWVVRACTQRGWRLCPRVHVMLFGDTRGT
ncbi:MAG: 7-carboxy-7-deazaguanine synthase QueE [Planctomycetota bacterium]